MTKTVFQFIILFIVLSLAQALLFNNICLFNVAVPFVFIYFIIRLPITLGTNWVLTLSFLLGLSVDICANTQGMNALACTILAMSRRGILHLYFPREDELSNPEPSVRSLGINVYSRYLLTFVVAYCIVIYTIEACSFFLPFLMLMRIIFSSLLTFLLLLGLDILLSQRE
ncbi:MAG: rod shape-determining protein MreD [Muribaculum sp.]|nr:rod shape-determining protein MreD [Muribaculaceae bacterium]MCM1080988.1 rod shape-determining protein MreD [Muribaculum sp.]